MCHVCCYRLTRTHRQATFELLFAVFYSWAACASSQMSYYCICLLVSDIFLNRSLFAHGKLEVHIVHSVPMFNSSSSCKWFLLFFVTKFFLFLSLTLKRFIREVVNDVALLFNWNSWPVFGHITKTFNVSSKKLCLQFSIERKKEGKKLSLCFPPKFMKIFKWNHDCVVFLQSEKEKKQTKN